MIAYKDSAPRSRCDIAARHWSLTDAACPLRTLRRAPIWVRRCAAALSYGRFDLADCRFCPPVRILY